MHWQLQKFFPEFLPKILNRFIQEIPQKIFWIFILKFLDLQVLSEIPLTIIKIGRIFSKDSLKKYFTFFNRNYSLYEKPLRNSCIVLFFENLPKIPSEISPWTALEISTSSAPGILSRIFPKNVSNFHSVIFFTDSSLKFS